MPICRSQEHEETQQRGIEVERPARGERERHRLMGSVTLNTVRHGEGRSGSVAVL